MSVRFLDQTLINQIAAGEVIERPASAIKELIENAIDAKARKIDIAIKDGGRTLISVTDDGMGMSLDDLQLCVERHATSKIPDGDLFNIRTLGFRGEALPSIGSVSRLQITSRPHNASEAWQLLVEGGSKHAPQPASAPIGTKVEVRDLFFATPVRLKFLKTATTEQNHITDIVHRQALANPEVEFTLRHNDKTVLKITKDCNPLDIILGKDFQPNALKIDFARGESRLTGWVSIPSYNRSNSTDQYLFVNGRPVKDKLFATALKVAYQDVLAGNRFPAAVLFLTCDPEDVDINVHPAKAEVRFRDSNLMRGFVIAAVREALQNMATQSSSTISDQAIVSFTPESLSQMRPPMDSSGMNRPYLPSRYGGGSSGSSGASPRLQMPQRTQYTPLGDVTPAYHGQASALSTVATFFAPDSAPSSHADRNTTADPEQDRPDYPLGFAKTQVQETYIIAETMNELIIVDQHAAHERLVYEKMKHQLAEGIAQGTIKRQALLIPTVIELTQAQFSTVKEHLEKISSLGFTLETFAQNSLFIREIPVLLTKCDLKKLFLDFIGEIMDRGTDTAIEQTFHDILADKACKNSIRAGRRLSMDEMNALLRQIEETPFSSQCNHGRPTYLKLSKSDLEKLFERA